MKTRNLLGGAFVAATALVVGSCAGNGNELRLTGQLEGTNDTVLVSLIDLGKNDLSRTDTVVATDGKFDHTIALDGVTQALITNVKDGQPTGRIMVCAVPGETCNITGEWDGEYFVDGTKFYQDYNQLDRLLTPIQHEHNALIERCQQQLEAGASEDSIMAIYQTESATLEERMQAAQFDFIRQNPKSEACATILAQLPPEKAQEAYDLMNASVLGGRMATLIKPVMERVEKELARLKQAENIAEGKPAPDFTLNDLQGRPLSLSSLRGKYVVLDFWGSWCGWCIKGIPQMKEYYKKYAGRFEILGIDCNDSEEDWREAVEKHELPWLHVYNPKEGDVTTTYAIEGFPTKIVVDPDGNIARVVVGEDPAFYTYLDELFK